MTQWVLGISCYYHNSAAAIVHGSDIVAAAEEERFTRKKNDPRFPTYAIDYCLEAAGIEPDELDAVIFYDNPALTFDRVTKSLIKGVPSSKDQWIQAAPLWLGSKLRVQEAVFRKLQVEVPVLFAEHHFSHAASAFYPSPFTEAAVLTMDGVGEWATTTIGYGHGSDLQIYEEVLYPHSLGLLYSAFTYYCGFKVNSGEYKLMGLAAYGEPKYADIIQKELLDVRPDGSYRLNGEYFGFIDSTIMTNDKFHKLLGGEPRSPESRITQREMDIAASIQQVLEDAVLLLGRRAKELTNSSNLVLAGGVALNCVANGKLLKSGLFDSIWIQPASGDSGASLGCALLAVHQHFGVDRVPNDVRDSQKGSYLGPSFTNAEIKAFLEYHEYPYEEVSDEERAKVVAEAISQGKIVGYFVGRMEFGPRSLGARSILGDARGTETQSIMNLKIKYRESFRPFAPSVLDTRVSEYFDLDHESPYMLLVAQVAKDKQYPVGNSMDDDDMLPRINQVRSEFPAITHVDYSARIQSVGPLEKPDYYAVLKEFEAITGCGMIVNTSFNVRGEPIVCSPEDAYRCFMRTDMDLLVLENNVLVKGVQPDFGDIEDWRDEYELD